MQTMTRTMVRTAVLSVMLALAGCSWNMFEAEENEAVLAETFRRSGLPDADVHADAGAGFPGNLPFAHRGIHVRELRTGGRQREQEHGAEAQSSHGDLENERD